MIANRRAQTDKAPQKVKNMPKKLFSLCWLGDGVHWVLIAGDGKILESSPCGFSNKEDALIDVNYRI
jgi:hypothetical protein